MPDLDDQNPFTPPLANVDDVVQPAALALAERGARLAAYLLDNAPARRHGGLVDERHARGREGFLSELAFE